jgi:hypothetical protein
MNIKRKIIVLAFGIGFGASAHSEGLCAAGEAVIFNCDLPKSVSSLCQSDSDGTLTYRNGRDGKVNLKISDAGEKIKNIFYFSDIPYASGGESHIRFIISNYTYYIYDKVKKTDDGPEFSAGIVILKRGEKVANLVCQNDASIRERAYHTIDRESYRPIGAQ